MYFLQCSVARAHIFCFQFFALPFGEHGKDQNICPKLAQNGAIGPKIDFVLGNLSKYIFCFQATVI